MIKKKQKKNVIEVDLTGPQGNVFYLLGLAQTLSKQIGFDSEEVLAEMQSSVYEHLKKDDIVIMQFGHNDAAKEKTERYVDIEGI